MTYIGGICMYHSIGTAIALPVVPRRPLPASLKRSGDLALDLTLASRMIKQLVAIGAGKASAQKSTSELLKDVQDGAACSLQGKCWKMLAKALKEMLHVVTPCH